MTIALITLSILFLLINVWQIAGIFRDLSAGVLASVAEMTIPN